MCTHIAEVAEAAVEANRRRKDAMVNAVFKFETGGPMVTGNAQDAYNRVEQTTGDVVAVG